DHKTSATSEQESNGAGKGNSSRQYNSSAFQLDPNHHDVLWSADIVSTEARAPCNGSLHCREPKRKKKTQESSLRNLGSRQKQTLLRPNPGQASTSLDSLLCI